MEKESEILEASMKILQKARFATVTFNPTAFHFICRVEKHLNDQFEAVFDAIYKTDDVLEAETVEVA